MQVTVMPSEVMEELLLCLYVYLEVDLQLETHNYKSMSKPAAPVLSIIAFSSKLHGNA